MFTLLKYLLFVAKTIEVFAFKNKLDKLLKNTNMAQLTINIKADVKEKLQLLAKKRKSTVSNLINELVIAETEKIKLKPSKKGLGTYLSELPIKEIPVYKSDKELLGRLKQEKQLDENIH